MAKYHLNPEKGPMPCRASSGNCPYGDEDVHYSSKAEAQAAYESSLTDAHPLPAHSKTSSLEEDLERYLEISPDAVDVDDLVTHIDKSPALHAGLAHVIEDRAARTVGWGEELEALSPYRRPPLPQALDRDSFRALKQKYDSYRDQTAAMVEAYGESSHYRPKTLLLPYGASVGIAQEGTSYLPNTIEWLRERYDSVGGSDVGTLAVMDFTPEDRLMFWDRRSMDSTESSKLTLPTPETIARENWASRGSKTGALYRGTVWEQWHRDKFAEDNPDLDVYTADGQYFHPDRPWQKVNFDGLLAPKGGRPNGILEMKTGADSASWSDGPPLSYRAQVLYYLDASELDYALVSVSIHDGPLQTYRLDRNDPVAPGTYDKPMSVYRQERVESWFEDLRARRAA